MLKHYFQLPRAVHILCLGTFINRAGTLLLPFLTLYLTKERGMHAAFATLALGVYGLGSLFGALLGGHLADWIGRRPVMLISLLGGACFLRVFGLLESPGVILAAVGMFAVLADMYRPAASAMIADLVSPEHRPHAFGLLYLAINLGFSIGATGGGILAQYWFPWLFWVDAVTAAIYAGIIILFIKETLPWRRHTSNPSTAWAPREDGAPAPPGPEQTRAFDALRHILGDSTFLVFCAGSLCVGLMYMQSLSSFPVYLDRRGLGTDEYGQLIALNGVLIVCFQLPVTALLSRFNRATLMIGSAALSGVGFGLTGLATGFWLFASTVVVWTAGEMMSAPFMSAIVTDLAPVRLRARYLGVFTMCFSSAMMLGAPLGGAVLDRLGGTYLWGGCFAMGLLAAAFYLSIHGPMTHTRRSHRTETGAASA